MGFFRCPTNPALEQRVVSFVQVAFQVAGPRKAGEVYKAHPGGDDGRRFDGYMLIQKILTCEMIVFFWNWCEMIVNLELVSEDVIYFLWLNCMWA